MTPALYFVFRPGLYSFDFLFMLSESTIAKRTVMERLITVSQITDIITENRHFSANSRIKLFF